MSFSTSEMYNAWKWLLFSRIFDVYLLKPILMSSFTFPDFVVSPSGSTGRTIEEDGFNASSREPSKTDEQTSSQSVSSTRNVEGQARSLPNVGSFENNAHLVVSFNISQTALNI